MDDASTPWRFRLLDPDDGALLLNATLLNLNWCGERFTAQDVVGTPTLAHYTRLVPERGDLGVVAERPDDGDTPGGVAWLLFLGGDDPGYGFVAEGVPELSLCVLPDQRGRGLGRMLLDRLVIAAAARGVEWISLSVEAANPAIRLYRRAGFRPVPDAAAGTMLLEVERAPVLQTGGGDAS